MRSSCRHERRRNFKAIWSYYAQQFEVCTDPDVLLQRSRGPVEVKNIACCWIIPLGEVRLHNGV